MLKEAVSARGRWVGLSPIADDEDLHDDERRVWIRYPSKAEATCQPAHPSDGDPLVARVRNISRGGINLVVKRWFEPGMLLSVQLPGETDQNGATILAYIVRATAKAGGEWVLGCTFATELSDADLKSLGVSRSRPDAPDQRSWERFPCEMRVTYQVVKTDSPSPKDASVFDISPMGIGIVIPEEIELGTLLNLELRR